MKCQFCENFLLTKEIDEKSRKEHDIKHEYSVALVTRAWRETKKAASRSVDFRHMGLGYKLNYCPECGANFTREKKR